MRLTIERRRTRPRTVSDGPGGRARSRASTRSSAARRAGQHAHRELHRPQRCAAAASGLPRPRHAKVVAQRPPGRPLRVGDGRSTRRIVDARSLHRDSACARAENTGGAHTARRDRPPGIQRLFPVVLVAEANDNANAILARSWRPGAPGREHARAVPRTGTIIEAGGGLRPRTPRSIDAAAMRWVRLRLLLLISLEWVALEVKVWTDTGIANATSRARSGSARKARDCATVARPSTGTHLKLPHRRQCRGTARTLSRRAVAARALSYRVQFNSAPTAPRLSPARRGGAPSRPDRRGARPGRGRRRPPRCRTAIVPVVGAGPACSPPRAPR